MRKAITTAVAVGGLTVAGLTAAAGTAEAASPAQWAKLAECESGGRANINTGNGYYGAYQISPRTWRAFGGLKYAPLPHQATLDEQTIVAAAIAKGQGWNAWPTCSREAGLWGTAPTAPGSAISRSNDQAASRSAARKPLAKPGKGTSPGKGKHVVEPGETLSSIAKENKIDGGWKELFEANRSTVKNANVLQVGQVLTLPA